jgi:uncharacterized membrane protein
VDHGVAEVAAASAAVAARPAAVVREEAGDMKPSHFLNQLSDDAITAAIADAEKKSSGEIRVVITRQKVVDPILAAQKHFARLRMSHTRQRNGVLIFIAPATNKFAVIGDTGIHEKCGDGFWTQIASEISEYFKRSEWTSGIVHAVNRVGAKLAEHFPPLPGDVNELPNRVSHD